jgi:hypothetical protein
VLPESNLDPIEEDTVDGPRGAVTRAINLAETVSIITQGLGVPPQLAQHWRTNLTEDRGCQNIVVSIHFLTGDGQNPLVWWEDELEVRDASHSNFVTKHAGDCRHEASSPNVSEILSELISPELHPQHGRSEGGEASLMLCTLVAVANVHDLGWIVSELPLLMQNPRT